MTVSTTVSSVSAQGNGLTTAFAYNFIMPAASDAVVTILDTTVTPNTSTPLASNLYTITGIGATTGGTVTYPLSGPALAAGFYITIARVVPYQQLISIRNQGDFFPAAVEEMGDNLEYQIQQQQNALSRAIQINPVDTELPNPLPPAGTRANQTLVFDSTGQPTVGSVTSAIVSAEMQPVVDAPTRQDGFDLLVDGIDAEFNNGVTISAGGLAVAGGAAITGGAAISGGLSVATGSVNIVAGGLTTNNGVTVSSGGITVTGNSLIVGTLTATSGTTGSQVVNYSQFPFTQANPQSAAFPGAVFKGGLATSGASGVLAIPFATAFPTACVSVVASLFGAAPNTYLVAPTAKSTTTASFVTTVAGVGTSGIGFTWIAMGY